MIWYAAAFVLLLAALVLRLGLLTYAIYVICGLLIVSRYLTRVWGDSLEARRVLVKDEAEVGVRPSL